MNIDDNNTTKDNTSYNHDEKSHPLRRRQVQQQGSPKEGVNEKDIARSLSLSQGSGYGAHPYSGIYGGDPYGPHGSYLGYGPGKTFFK